MAENSFVYDHDSDNEDLDNDADNRQALIFLVDASASMFQNRSVHQEDAEECPFLIALKSALGIFKKNIFTNSTSDDLIGVTVFGNRSEHLRNGKGMVGDLVDLCRAEAGTILELEKIWTDEKKLGDLLENAGDDSLSEAFAFCESKFMPLIESDPNLKCHICLFTNNDSPCGDSTEAKKRIKQQVAKLITANVAIHLFSFGDKFDYQKFYEELLSSQNGNTSTITDQNAKDLSEQVCQQVYRQQPVHRLLFRLDNEVNFKIKLYKTISDAKMPCLVPLDHRTNEILKPKTTKWAESSSGELEIIRPSEAIKVTSIGGASISMSHEEMKNIKTAFGPPGLRLLGFRSIDELKAHLYFRPALFVYPEDEERSITIFRALLERCKARQKAILCCLIARANVKPRLVVLIPQLSEESGTSNENLPPGFNLLYIPYACDVRKLPYGDLVAKNSSILLRANEQQVNMARQLVAKLTMKSGYHPEIFPKPEVHVLWNTLEAEGLKRPQVEEFNDLTIPDVERINKKVKALAGDFNAIIGHHGTQMTSAMQPTCSQSQPSVSSRVLTAAIEDAAKSRTLHKFTVAQLQEYLKVLGKDVYKKRKPELILMVENLAGK